MNALRQLHSGAIRAMPGGAKGARHTTALAALLLLSGAASMHAQTPPSPPSTFRFDTAASRSYTLAAVLGASRTAVSLVRGDTAIATSIATVERLLARLDRPAVTRLPIAAVFNTPPRFGSERQAAFGRIARWQRKSDVAGLGAGDDADLDSLSSFTRGVLKRAMGRRIPPVSKDSVDSILAPMDELHRQHLIKSILQSLEKLNRFERKYGPNSPQLNAVEVGLNYIGQFIPLFMPDREGWPSRWEMVASYVPTYLTMVDSKARPVTAAELGLRAYLWNRGWGGVEGGVLRPGYLSFGIAVAGARDGAFVSPLQGKARIGGFLGWGETKVAFLGGAEKRFLVTRQMQIVPWLF